MAWGPPSLLYNEYQVFPVGKAAGAWRWSHAPSIAEVKERVELHLYFFSGPMWPVLSWTLPIITIIIIIIIQYITLLHLGWRGRNQQDASNLMFIIKHLSQHVSGMMPETCWDKSLIINIRLVASCWFLSLHPTFMMHGHKCLKLLHLFSTIFYKVGIVMPSKTLVLIAILHFP